MFAMISLLLGMLESPSLGLELHRVSFVDKWTYEDLMKSADLVIVGRAIKTEATSEKLNDDRWQYEIVGQSTEFELVTVLKGKSSTKTLRVLHYKFGDHKLGDKANAADRILIDGPTLIRFRTKGGIFLIDGDKITTECPDYLLYLKNIKDDQYEPVSGKLQTQLSVREMIRPPVHLSGQ